MQKICVLVVERSRLLSIIIRWAFKFLFLVFKILLWSYFCIVNYFNFIHHELPQPSAVRNVVFSWSYFSHLLFLKFCFNIQIIATHSWCCLASSCFFFLESISDFYKDDPKICEWLLILWLLYKLIVCPPFFSDSLVLSLVSTLVPCDLFFLLISLVA